VALALGLALGIQAFIIKPYQIPSESMEPTLDVGQRVLVNRFIYHFTDPQPGHIIVFHPPAGAEQTKACASITENQLRSMAARDVAQETGAGTPSHSNREEEINQRMEELRQTETVRLDRQPCNKPTAGESDQNFIKRIVAGPGDKLVIVNGCAVVNGEATAAANEASTKWQVCERYNNGDFEGRNLPKPITILPDHYFMMGDNRGASDDSRYWGPIPRDWIIGKALATYWPPDRIGIF
jgi:signal peptidase I